MMRPKWMRLYKRIAERSGGTTNISLYFDEYGDGTYSAEVAVFFGPNASRKVKQYLMAHQMLNALQRVTHPAADDSDFEYAQHIVRHATKKPTLRGFP